MKASEHEVPMILLHPCKRIATACGIAPRTVRMWMLKHAFPVFHLPTGRLATTVGMIEEWARERRAKQLAMPCSNGKGRPRYGDERFAVRVERAV